MGPLGHWRGANLSRARVSCLLETSEEQEDGEEDEDEGQRTGVADCREGDEETSTGDARAPNCDRRVVGRGAGSETSESDRDEDPYEWAKRTNNKKIL